MALLTVRDLSVSFTNYRGSAMVLDRVGLEVAAGEIFGLVGESGCGKSVTARAVLRLISDPPGRITSGSVVFDGENLLEAAPQRMRRIRGGRISMIFQEPMSSLNPVFTIGSQMREVVRIHRRLRKKDADALCIEMLRQVQMPDPETVLCKYPHQLSGGMRQRVMIATALICGPGLLIADEPTTALDVTVQGQVLAILCRLTRERRIAVWMITHDMGVIAQICDRVAVMYAGRIVETAPVRELFAAPRHPYTRGLIAAIPDIDGRRNVHPIVGSVPALTNPPPGCRFHPRCPVRMEICSRTVPELLPASDSGHLAACHALTATTAAKGSPP